MHAFENPFPPHSTELLINDIASDGEELADDDLVQAVGGRMRVDIEVVSYDDYGKVVDHQIDIFYI